MFRAPIHAVGQRYGATQALIELLRERRGIEVKLQTPATVLRFELIANELGQKRTDNQRRILRLICSCFQRAFGLFSSMAKRRSDRNTRLTDLSQLGTPGLAVVYCAP